MTEKLLTGMLSLNTNKQTKGWFESYLVANPEDSFSHDEAHIMMNQLPVPSYIHVLFFMTGVRSE